MATYRSQDITTRRRHSVCAKAKKRKVCVMHPANEIGLNGSSLFTSIWGTVLQAQASVNNGQMGEEEVHGAVESGVLTDYSKDDPIPHQGKDTEQGERCKKNSMNLWAKAESKPDKRCDIV